MNDTPETLMADASFMGSLSAGDAAATSRWFDAHQAAFPEAETPSPPSSSSTSAPCSPGSPEAAKAAIKTAMGDADFMKRVNGGDPAALRQWEDLHRSAHPPEESTTDPRGYAFRPAEGFEPDPVMRKHAVTAFSALGVSHRDAADIADTWHQVVARQMPPELVEQMGESTWQSLVAEMGQAAAAKFVDGARKLVVEAERHWPGLRAMLQSTGAGNDLALLRQIGRLAQARQQGH